MAAPPQTYFIDATGSSGRSRSASCTRRRLRAPVREDRLRDRRPPARRLAVEARLVKRYGGGPSSTASRSRSRRGELVALLGPNGAGKTTTVEILEGYRRADGGRIRVLGVDPARERPRPSAARRADAPGAAASTHARGRARRSGQYARFHADPRDPDELLDLVGLGPVAGTRYRRLSGGERQRLGAWRSRSSAGPSSLVLDEPTAGMDPEARAATASDRRRRARRPARRSC